MFSWRNKKNISNEYPQHMFMWRNKKNISNEYPQHMFSFSFQVQIQMALNSS